MQDFGIIEVVLGAVGCAIFHVWRMRLLKREVVARKARQAAEAEAERCAAQPA